MRTNGERSTLAGRLSPDAVHHLLADRRRRYVLYCLYLLATPMRLPDVADRVVEWECGRSAETVPDERLRVYMELYHSHVPKLADHGVVTYDQDGDVLELAPNASQLRPSLERAAEADLNPTGPGSV